MERAGRRPTSATRSRSRTRPGSSTPAAASNCCDTPGDPGNGDVIDYHQYQGPALPAPDAKRASIDGEHGGLTLSVPGHLWPTASINPYGAVKDAAELNDTYVANNDDLRDLGARNGLSGGVYTQITDVEGEQNGFFTYDRQVEKVDEARVRAINLSVIAAGSQPAPAPPPGHARARRGRALDARRGHRARPRPTRRGRTR